MPLAVQSASVPVCSSAFEDSLSPPSPTQNADAVVEAVAEPQLAAGSIQLPLTLLNVVPVTA